MEDFEEQALSSSPTAPKIYIDDAFTIWKRNDVEDFLHTASHHSTTNHSFYNGDLEWQHNSLSWHIGHKRIRRTPHTTSVYQKPTHWSVPVLWHTTLNQFNDVLSSAYTMHRKISSLNHLLPLRKKKHLNSVLVSNGYSYSFVTQIQELAGIWQRTRHRN